MGVYLQKVYKDVDNEHDVDNKLNDVEWIVQAGKIGACVCFVEDEGSREGREYGCIYDQNQYHPVPYCLK